MPNRNKDYKKAAAEVSAALTRLLQGRVTEA